MGERDINMCTFAHHNVESTNTLLCTLGYKCEQYGSSIHSIRDQLKVGGLRKPKSIFPQIASSQGSTHTADFSLVYCIYCTFSIVPNRTL